MQHLLDGTARFLQWANMRAKVPKCACISYGKGKTCVEVRHPSLTLSGLSVPMVSTESGIKILGHTLYPDLSLDRQKEMVVSRVQHFLNTIDKSRLSNIQKVRAYNLFLRSLVNWDFAIYEFPRSWVESDLKPLIVCVLKCWLRIPRAGNHDVLFLSRDRHGFGIPDVVTVFKQARTRSYYSLKTADDLKAGPGF